MSAGRGHVMTTTRRLPARALGQRRSCVLAAALIAEGGGCGKVPSTAVPDGHGDGAPDAAIGMTGEPDGGDSAPDAGICGGDVDTTSDGANCGACGHSCGGGACVASRCQPVALATGQRAPIELAIDAANVYWTTADGNVMRGPIAGGSATVLASGQSSPWGVAVDAATVYWVNAVSPGQVMSVPIAGGAATVLVDQQRRPVHLAVAEGIIYWTNSASGTIMSVPASGGVPTQVADGQGAVVAIAVDGDTLYWSSIGLGVIRSLPLVGGGLIATIVRDQDAVALFIRDAKVYWANVEIENDVASVFELLPSAGTPVALGSGPAPYAAVADGANVYWTDETSGTVTKVSVGGGTPIVVAWGQPGASAMAIDGANIYWITEATGGAIMKLAK